MRLRTALALAATLMVAGCGDEPEVEPDFIPTRPAPRQPADTPIGDAPTPTDPAARPADPGAEARAQPGQRATRGEPVAEGAPPRPGERLYTVQIAAFTNPDAAALWRNRLAGQGWPVWTSVSEVGGRTFHRVRIGAVPTVAEARRLGALLTERYEWPVWIAPLSAADRIPADAVERTRDLIGG